jgi:uncharacterized membrane protein
MKTDRKLDTMLSGLVAGILLPAITLLVFWLVKYDGGFFEFLSQFQGMGLLSKVISLSAIPNLLLFFICIWTNRNFSARGVIFATLIVALVMLVLKFA